ncbi:hypothetical protein A3B36_03075 [Candidatus Uhrbacteria bacterium RIFCSPLOWO2_01_FULL_55_36]|uniref:Uncharacterized protein n=1 Tax=Candidatus Uhrbacteria bacterium RIFCSPLOWO2_01_FULL_55_36 TaxID=1802404 RepID=A0A1F7UZA7_9BACT|nr:MAG: hypothetical protein A3B36_03075 [Candidatus Uhrbacteria bacterium RIFCSPLOWO2_01_FULL_55_36]
MNPQYYHDVITEKSWRILQDWQRQHRFILIGGWAVYLFTHALKSKDIDIAVSLEELGKLKEEYAVAKNERLKKYEARRDEIDIDIYVEYYSNPGLPVEALRGHTVTREGFSVPEIEYLLLLKENAWMARRGSDKGEKDAIDLIALLQAGADLRKYRDVLLQHAAMHLLDPLRALVEDTRDVSQLGLNQHAFSRLKKEWLSHIVKE